MPQITGRLSYKIPSMKEIACTSWNGFRVASTFSGCGGSSLGMRMAGFKVLYANERDSYARQSYLLNCDPSTFVDERDIKDVDALEVLEVCGLDVGELDILEGSPPCQAFSEIGEREKKWGKESGQRDEEMFSEFIRLLRGILPKCFVAENVRGMMRGSCRQLFLSTIQELEESGYWVKVKLLDAQWYGVPQQRQRLIFIGVRDGLKDGQGRQLLPHFPDPLPYHYGVQYACPWITRISSEVTGEYHKGRRRGAEAKEVSPCITRSSFAAGWIGNEIVETVDGDRRRLTIREVKRLCSFPDDFLLLGRHQEQWGVLGNAVPPLMMRTIARTLRDKILRQVSDVEREETVPLFTTQDEEIVYLRTLLVSMAARVADQAELLSRCAEQNGVQVALESTEPARPDVRNRKVVSTPKDYFRRREGSL